MKRAIIYARVSTDDQRNNYSIPSQIMECVNYAESHGYTIVGNRYVDKETGQDAASGIPAFVDDFSSRELNRPGLDAAYDYLKNYGFDVVIVYSIDRLDRDPYKLHTHEYGFASGKAAVEYVKGDYNNTPEGQFLKTVVASAAKLDNDWRTERFNRGKRQKARRGLFVGGCAPYGYEIDRGAPGGLQVIPEEAEVIRWIYDSYVVGGLSIYNLLDALNQSEARPKLGGTWQKSSIAKILANTAYIGTVHYNKFKRSEKTLELRDNTEWIEITVPAILDNGIFDQAQTRLRENRENRRKQPDRFYMLSGLVYCEHCGRPYVSQTAKAGRNKRVNDAQTYRHREKQGHCKNRTVSARILEPMIWSKVETLLMDPQNLKEGYDQALEQERKAHSKQLEMREIIRKDITKFQKMMENLTRAYTDPDIQMTKLEYQEQRARLAIDLKTAKERLSEVESQLSDIPTPEEYANLDRFAEEIKRRITGPDWQPTPANKRRIMELLHARVILDGDNGHIVGWFGDPLGFSYITR
ncbi:MAG: hypothetical protein D9V45_12925 [Chloroflexi bacterium]|nr:MAG: hypothetical protein D9V45_12925 [Chloroflexota bacterium]